MEVNSRSLVSICVPIYNGGKYLSECLDSAISQTYRSLEIVISDDASKDNSLEIVNSYIGKTNIPISIHHHQPSGIGANWNNCVRKSNGDYIKFLFQDDLLEPNCIEDMMQIAKVDSNIGLVFSPRNIIYDSQLFKEMDIEQWMHHYEFLEHSWHEPLSTIQSGKKLLHDPKLLSAPTNKVGEPTCVLLKKSVLIQAGLFDERLKQTLDYEAWYRIMKYCMVGYTNQKLASFRLHQTQTSFINREENLDEERIVKTKILKELSGYLHRDVRYKILLELRFPFIYAMTVAILKCIHRLKEKSLFIH